MREVPFKAIGQAALANLESVLDSLTVKRERSGDSWLILNPTREDKHLGSFKVGPDGLWYENATGDKGGDLISLVAYCRGVDQVTAAKELQDRFGPFETKSTKLATSTKLPPPTEEYIYRDAAGMELYRVRRYDTPDGKEFRPYTSGSFKYPPEPRPLYGLDRLADVNKPTVLVVEGEKTADAAARLFPTLAVITSPAGSKAAGHADWTPLQGRKVVIWADNDEPGQGYAGDVHSILKNLGVEAQVVDVPKTWPNKWDLADPPPAGVGPADLQDMIKQAQSWTGGPAGGPMRRLDVLTWNQFRGKPIPPIEWLCEPMFPKIAFGIVAAQPGHGKSFILLELGVSLATGLPFMGRPVASICGVGLLSLEDDENTIHRRLQAIIDAYGPTWTDDHHRLLDANLRIIQRRRLELAALSPENLDMALSGLAEELGEAMKTTEAKPGILVIDTLNAVNDGDENNATETRGLVATINALHLALDCSVWVIHHYRKSGTGKNSPSLADRMHPEIIRGSGAFWGGIRGSFQMGWVNKLEADKAGLLDWTDPHHYAVVALTKINDGPKSKWELWKHIDGGVMVPVKDGDQAIARIQGADAVQKLATQDRVLVAILTAATTGKSFDRKETAASIGISEGSLRATLSNLRKEKLVTKTDTLTPGGFSKAQGLAQGTASDDEPEGGEAA